MKVFHIDQFKCTLCSNWFCPPFNLPYRLKCTHSICTNCLQKSVQNKTNQIICPQDLQRNKISQINVNQSTKKALQRLLKQHKNFTQTNHLQCIKSLSMNFDQLLDSKQIQLKNLSTLIDQIFQNQIKRLRQIYQKIKIQINRPFRIVNDWKEVVRNYLKKVKNVGPSIKGCINQLNHYIEEGRKIKLDINEYLKYDFKQLIEYLLIQPQVCFTRNFSIFNSLQKEASSQPLKNFSNIQNKKQYESQKQICLEDVTNNFDQSSIRINKNAVKNMQLNSHKMSLFQQLIQQTPKQSKLVCESNFPSNKNKKSPLKQLIFSNSNNQQSIEQSNKFYNNKNTQIQKSEKQTISKFWQSGKKQVQENQYNKIIKQKIKKLKTNQISLENSLNKHQIQNIYSQNKINKLGKSLQYSPECYSDQLQRYSIHDSLHQNNDQQSNLKDYKSNINMNQNFQHSLHSFYQEQSTILKPTFETLNEQANEEKNRLKQKQKTQTRQKMSVNQQQDDEQQQQMLLDQKSNRKNASKNKNMQPNNWHLQNLNFLKQWKVNRNNNTEEELEIIQKYGGYDCEKEKNKYIRKIQENRVRQILTQMVVGQNYIELVGHSLNDVNLQLLLSQINWNYRNIEIVKFIKTSLNDYQLNQLLNFVVRSNVHTLMLSYNNLSEMSLDALLNFVGINNKLKNIYLPKNNISLLKGNARTKMNLLKEKGINLYM